MICAYWHLHESDHGISDDMAKALDLGMRSSAFQLKWGAAIDFLHIVLSVIIQLLLYSNLTLLSMFRYALVEVLTTSILV